MKVNLETDPAGAEVYVRPYEQPSGPWEHLGTTPLQEHRVPFGYYTIKLQKAGYEDAFRGVRRPFELNEKFTLDPVGTFPEGMVRIEAWTPEDGTTVPSFFFDRYEVSNAKYKEFVDAGGYSNPQYWKQPFVKDGVSLSHEEAMAELVDTTGRPGPASWIAGDYPDGKGNDPVGGVSWYEAAAYAEFVGKTLPTSDHWGLAAGLVQDNQMVVAGTIGRKSNFDGGAPRPVGEGDAMNPSGAFDMAGNVREWCSNAIEGGRVIRGGAWDDIAYMYSSVSRQDAWDRSPRNGFRCALYQDLDEIPAIVFESLELDTSCDFSDIEPVSDEVFSAYLGRYAYDPAPLNETVEERDDQAEDFVIETVSFDAAYGDERVIARLMLPKSGTPPYQTVIVFGGSGIVGGQFNPRWPPGDFLLKTGRAILVPSYKGTFERTGDFDLAKHWPSPEHRHTYAEHLTYMVKDFRRSIDYLETREDIDAERLGFWGFSWGGVLGSVLLAVENRVDAAVFHLGGLACRETTPESWEGSYAPRVKTPVLMLNGRYDTALPADTCARPLLELLGTDEEDKKLLVYETDHFIPEITLIKETLPWFDRHLGPVGVE